MENKENKCKTSIKPNSLENGPSRSTVANSDVLIRKTLTLRSIEYYYKKYFSDEVQNTGVIIIHLFNIINDVNKYYTDQKEKKLPEYNEEIHLRNVEVLMSALVPHFIKVATVFDDNNFDSACKVFFSCILNSLHSTLSSFIKGNIFHHFINTIKHCLKTSNIEHSKMILIVVSETLAMDCRNIIFLVGMSEQKDARIKNRLPLFFITLEKSRKYFKPILDVVTNNSTQDLKPLIDNAVTEYHKNSQFKHIENKNNKNM